MATIIVPRKLSDKLKVKAAESGYLPDELGVEILRKNLDEELDPEDLVEQYQTLSDKYHAEAKDLLKEGDLVQASEKLWGAAALAVKRIAAERGLSLDKHGGLWSFVTVLSKERKDREIIRLFYSANALHRNFYENEMTRDMVDVAADDVNTLITKISVIV